MELNKEIMPSVIIHNILISTACKFSLSVSPCKHNSSVIVRIPEQPQGRQAGLGVIRP